MKTLTAALLLCLSTALIWAQTPADAPAPTPAPAAPTAPAKPRDKPPIIIIKVDDMRQGKDGKVPGGWIKLADYLHEKKVKAGFGVICSTLPESGPDYCNWIKEKAATGEIEFWFHGWDHAVHEEEGQKYNEFNHRTAEDQAKRFADSQAAAKDKLGLYFATFGPGGGVYAASFDQNTIAAMAGDPNMKVWLYPTPIDEPGKKLEAEGKVTILDRVYAVNLESKVGQPDFQRLVDGLAKNPDREYFVLQGHPMQWGDGPKWTEFTKIIDYLIEQKAVFMTPSEYVASKKK